MKWLVKEEPANYPFSRFVEDGTTVWSGVRNPVAQKNLRAMKPGDKVFYYHTGNEKAVVGVAIALMFPERHLARVFEWSTSGDDGEGSE
jgi:predicted RNA-binding protein with PUA-like domain